MLLKHRRCQAASQRSATRRAIRKKTTERPTSTEACGHTVHAKCLLPRQLGPWVAPSARDKDLRELRTLRVRGSDVVYEAKDSAVAPDESALYMIDGGMNAVPGPSDYPLLAVDRWD